MPHLSREAYVRFAILAFARQDNLLMRQDIDALVASAKTPGFGRTANLINSTIDFDYRGERHSLQAEMVWDAKRRAWLVLFDGHGPNDEVVDEMPDGTYRIDWGDGR